jgi:RNA polymerase sigma-70 factor (ECF subfamily)
MTFREQLIGIIPSLRAFALSLCGTRDMADDLVQEALTKAWASQDSYHPGTNFKAWIFTILRNHYFSQRRKAGREISDLDGAMLDTAAVQPEQEGRFDLTELTKALNLLPAEQREAIILVTAEGLSYEEAAQICGCAVGTIKSRINRARKKLGEAMSGEQHGKTVMAGKKGSSAA